MQNTMVIGGLRWPLGKKNKMKVQGKTDLKLGNGIRRKLHQKRDKMPKKVPFGAISSKIFREGILLYVRRGNNE